MDYMLYVIKDSGSMRYLLTDITKLQKIRLLSDS